MNNFLIDMALYHAACIQGPESETLVTKAQELLGLKDDESEDSLRVLKRFHGDGPKWGESVWQQLYDARNGGL